MKTRMKKRATNRNVMRFFKIKSPLKKLLQQLISHCNILEMHICSIGQGMQECWIGCVLSGGVATAESKEASKKVDEDSAPYILEEVISALSCQ